MKLESLKTLPAGLFWSAPLALDTDFTVEDPLALDYLAQQVGIWLFPGFTTRTSRAQYYAVVLYGLDLVEKAIARYNYPADDKTRNRLFERWERFWALTTIEFRQGLLERGDTDAMRGIRGATRAWQAVPRGKRLPLDYELISRQVELGGLGAYLSSLRAYGLVIPGTLQVSPLSRSIIDAFWTEKGNRDSSRQYEEYCLRALDLSENFIARSHGKLTLGGLGNRASLSSLTRRKRDKQQERLWKALFLDARDHSTLPLAESLILANHKNVGDPDTILHGMLNGRWKSLSDENKEVVRVALLFGRAAVQLLQIFNRAYGYVADRLVADFSSVATECFPSSEATALRHACTSLLEARDSSRFRTLQFHGGGFMTLLQKLDPSAPTTALQHILEFHRSVQRVRRGGGSWLRHDQSKLIMQVVGYSGHKSVSSFPNLKLNSVTNLLIDLGRCN